MSGLTHAQARTDSNGRYVELFLDPAVQDVVDRLHNGDPSIGWEGDERLALYMEFLPGHEQPSWVLERLEDDGVYRIVCRSKPGVDLRDLPRRLVEHDTRRGTNAILDALAHNAKLAKAQEDAAVDATAEKLEKVVWGIHKDVGSHNV